MSIFLQMLLILSINGIPQPSVLCNDLYGIKDPQINNSNGIWITSPGKNILFVQNSNSLDFGTETPSGAVIEVDDEKTYQEIENFCIWWSELLGDETLL